MATHSHPAANAPSDLQNSYGPEMAPMLEHHGSDGPQAIPIGGLEAASPGQQFAAPAYSTYAQKNNDYLPESSATAPPTSKKRVLGLPLWGIWVLLGLAIVVIGVALGVGLGVGLSQRDSTTSSSSSASTTPSSSSSSSPLSSSAATTTATPTSTGSSTTTSSTTTSSTSAVATDASVLICQNAYLDACTTISVPASSCSEYLPTYPRTGSFPLGKHESGDGQADIS